MNRTLFLNAAVAAALLVSGNAFAQTQSGGASPTPNPSGQTPTTQGPDRTQAPDSTMGPGSGDSVSSKVDDKKFLKDAALGGMTEVELGKLAAQKASDSKVKEFAQKMVDDHTKANDDLKQVASKTNSQVPESLDSKHQSRIDKLSKLSGKDFDKAYVKDQLKDHQTDVREFSNEAQSGSDPNVKAFAASTLPTLQHHLEMVKELNKTAKQMSKK